MQKIRGLFDDHPRMMSWLVLAVAMLIIFFVATRGVDLKPAQRAAMAVATVVLAGLCVWIVFWD